MLIVFVETESSEQDYFSNRFPCNEVLFAGSLEEVPAEAEALCIFIYSHVHEAFLQRHPRLKLIVTRSTSHAHIDLPACQARGIVVNSIETYGECTVAEHTFALLLAVARRLPEAARAHKKERFSYTEIRGIELRNKTLGLVGTGKIGRRLIRIATAFDMNVIAYDIRPLPLENVRYVSKEELMAASEIISLHIPLTPATFHFLDATAFSLCHRGVIVINTSGGGLIDTEALIEALDKGIVSGAGLDSLEEERVVRQEAVGVIADQIVKRVRSAPEEGENKRKPGRVRELRRLTRHEDLLNRPEVIFTPHTAFNCLESVDRVNQATVELIQAFLSGSPSPDIGAKGR